MQTVSFNIHGRDYQFFRPLAGGYAEKFNRAVKIAAMFDELEKKFDRMIEKGSYISKSARCALACKLMMHTGIRVGNESSAEGYMTKPHPNCKKEPQFVQTYGLTTLLPKHLTCTPRKVYLNFVGKKQIENSFVLTGKLAKQVREVAKECSEEETLFEVSAYELTKFIKRYVGRNFSPKDFRTMRANMVAWEKASDLMLLSAPTSKRALNAEIKSIAVHVSEHLNNTATVCKKSYIDDYLFMYFEMSRTEN